MTFDGKELTTQDSQPVYLLEFAQGGAYYRYTTIAEAITRTNLYSPEAIEMGNFSHSGDIPKDPLTVKLPLDNGLAQTFIGGMPEVVTTLTVYMTHYDDSETLAYWKGRVLAVTTSKSFVTLNCEPIFSSLRRRGPRAVYQRICRYALGGRGCNVDLDAYSDVLEVDTVTGNILAIPGAAALTDRTGGTLKAEDGTIRTIIAHDGSVVTISRVVASLEAGQDVTIYPRCNHDVEDCRDTFDNLGNFGGFPGMPTRNPMNNKIGVVD
jgi:uncharacterized phage protein (TIGR02218 family)